MRNNEFSMREDSMNNTISGLNRCYTDAESTGKDIPKNFAGVSKSGLFDMGVDTIQKQVGNITNSLFNVKNIVNKHSNEMFNMDVGMARAAQNIEIPQDFVTNETSQINTYNRFLLEKIDGRAVTDGQTLNDIAPVTSASGIASQEALGNINNNVATEQEKLDTNTGVIAQSLGGIDNANVTAEQKLNEATKIVSEALGNINKNQPTNEQVLDSSTVVTSQVLTDISNNNGQQLGNQNLDLNTPGISNIANSAASQKLTDFSSIASSVVTDVDNELNKINKADI